jgi:hypothetical protein
VTKETGHPSFLAEECLEDVIQRFQKEKKILGMLASETGMSFQVHNGLCRTYICIFVVLV